MNIPPSSHAAVLTRLILQKVMTSPSVKYMKEGDLSRLNKAFLSHDVLNGAPGFTFEYEVKKDNGGYPIICTMGFYWSEDQKDVKDREGNLWTMVRLAFRLSVAGAAYQNPAAFEARGECIHALSQFVSEISSMITGPVSCMTHDNDARLEKEEKERLLRAVEEITRVVKQNKLRHEMRIGSVRKWASYGRERALFSDIKPGTYKIKYDDGSSRKPNMKYYTLRIPDAPSMSWTFQRVDYALFNR